MKKLKVYGYRGWRCECPPAPNGSKQTREIVSAKSYAEAARLFGCSVHELKTYGGVTGNSSEIELAMSQPGTVFWLPLDGRWQNKHEWRKANSTSKGTA